VTRRALLVVLAAVGLALVPAGAASAHPLGNFTVNTADRVVVTADGVEVTHVVDLAEIPTVQLGQARAGVDQDGDGALSAAELTAHAARECERVAPLLSLQVDGAAAPLSVVTSTGESRPGTAGLATARLTCSLLAEQRPRESVSFSDPVALERNGWREVTAASQCGPLSGSSVPESSPSGLLSSYPEDLLSAPVDVTTASFSVRAGAACRASVGTTGATADEIAPRGIDGITAGFTGFLSRPDLTLPFALLSLGAAVLFGVLHAMAPGHGKTVMAAYLVGQRGTRRQALQLGAVVTFTHTASVLALGAVLAAGALAAPELVVPVTEVLSGVLLGVVGAYLAVLAVRRLRAGREHEHEHHHPHEHGHEHHHGHAHTGTPEPGAGHAHAPAAGGTEIQANGGGLALASRPVAHTHGGRTHTHAPLPDGPMSWKALAGMGVAGGLVPSPSALLVLLSATALGRPVFGVLLVIAYGVGMAVTLTAAGLLLLRARAVLDRRGWTGGRAAAVVRLLPLGTAAVVVLVGAGLVLRGLATGRGLL
jgi:nickel/cobalt exporter